MKVTTHIDVDANTVVIELVCSADADPDLMADGAWSAVSMTLEAHQHRTAGA